jgi:ribose 5-phosphate isomerase B
MITIAIGADHRGYELKQALQKELHTIAWLDMGAHSLERTDYPLYAHAVVKEMLTKKAELGILICGTGIGMSIVANRHPGIYAALAWSSSIAIRAKEEDYANILVIPSDYVTLEQAISMIKAWLAAKPKEGRYKERISMIDGQ